MRLLVVEDNKDLAAWLGKALRQAQYAIDIAYDGEDAEHLLKVAEYSAMILDLSLPKLDGLTLLKRLRQSGNKLPVIILTANASLDGRVAGLDSGADDYLAKPFEIAELEARIRAVVRRGQDRASSEITVGNLRFSGGTRQFFVGGEPLQLTPREYAVLEQLVMKLGNTVSKASLSESVFGFDDEADPSAIEIYIHRLRKKLESSSVQIATLRGLGYLLRHVE
ncbi:MULTISPECIES: response regulator [unclassified Rhizobium]|uniref:response regulator n=1 Tax=unclassified Rhizobium TaxID=2613769 RepID=UPI0007E95A3B|nr:MULTISPECIES: response regulator [unclassified Rhizobium]ANM14759.1 transcriptional regulatory protein TctD [Rhizobium sp. N324]ANM21148.1 transcriptional regulatory protein TctD [Rhizobium sp. N541]ANM27519.1 transcriptional regulatory protein TctD [Rhizobium sp. N941]OYC99862.1 transcriptional regulatory protein TctD [Rhizobium sp. N4311]